jgi:putative ABC transport system permease protein
MREVRQIVRGLLRRPASTLAAIGAFGVAVGMAAALAKLTSPLLLPQWSANAGRDIRFIATRTPFGLAGVGLGDFERLQRAVAPMELAASRPERAYVGTEGQGLSLAGEVVSPGYFRTLGGMPVIGRTLDVQDADPSAEPAIVISSRVWRRWFDASLDVIGSSVRLRSGGFMGAYNDDERTAKVVGVMPDTFTGTLDVWQRTDYWVPLSSHSDGSQRSSTFVRALGRVGSSAMAGDLDARVRALSAHAPPAAGMFGGPAEYVLTRVPPTRLPSLMGRRSPEELVGPLAVMVVLTLLIAAANLVSLLRSQMLERREELVTRAMLGASPGRLARRLCAEQVVLGLFGMGLAWWVALAVLALFEAVTPPAIGGWLHPVRELSVNTAGDARLAALIAVGGLAVLCATCVCQGIYALRDPLVRQRRRRSVARATYVFIIPQVCIAVAATVIVGSMARSFMAAEGQDLGYAPRGLVFVEFELPAAASDARAVTYRMMKDRVQAIPGTMGSAVVSGLPFTPSSTYVSPGGGRDAPRRAAQFIVTAGYFDTMAIAITAGRALDERDGPSSARVCVVSESLAALFWPGREPVGMLLAFTGPSGAAATERRMVVGVARDVRRPESDEGLWPAVYLPLEQEAVPLGTTIVARAQAADARYLAAVQAAIAWGATDLSIIRARSVTDAIAELRYPRRVAAGTVAVIGLLGIALTIAGLFAILTVAATHREKELAIRSALGASFGAIGWQLLRDALIVVGAGLVLGVLFATVGLDYVRARLGVDAAIDGIGLLAGIVGAAIIVAVAAIRPTVKASRPRLVDVLKST